MAEPIQFVYRAENHPEARLSQIERTLAAAPAEHYEALMELWATLDTAHKCHLLPILRGAMSASSYITGEISEAMKTEGAINGMRNLIMMAEMLGALDPQALHAVVKALPTALTEANTAASAKKPPSLWQLFRSFTSVEARRALGVGAAMLTAIGRSMGEK